MLRILSALLTAALLACAPEGVKGNGPPVNAAAAASRAVEGGIQTGGGTQTGGQSDRKSFDAKSYGVAGDGSTNDATNLQAALTAASGAGVLDVLLPPGQYRLGAAINVPKNVRLVGFNSGTHPRPESGTWTPSRNVDFDKGTVIRCTADAGNEAGPPCVTVRQNGALEGVSIYHPNQSPTAATPTAYPWAISLAGMDARVERVELVNPFKGIYVGNFSHRATVRDVTGQPLKIGVEVDKNLDVTRLQSVHFVPNWSYKTGDSNGAGGAETGPHVWAKANGTAFLIRRADSIQGSDLFSLGYQAGMRFERSAGPEDSGSANGAAYGDFVNVSMDVCNSCIDISDAGAVHGLSFTNVSLVPYVGANPVGIRVRPTNAGQAQFRNVKVWGAATSSFQVEGSGLISIVGSSSAATTGYTAELGGTGVVVLRDAAMLSADNHVRVGASVSKAYVSDVVTAHARVSPVITNLGAAGQLVTNHTVWYTPTLAGSWTNYDAANWESAAYALTGNGYEVRIKGYIKGGSLGTIFTLPAGLCPPKMRRFVVYSTSGGVNKPASIQVNPSPGCTVQQIEGGNQILSLDINYTMP